MGEIVVFDLGGVLFDFRGDELVARSSRRSIARDEVQATWVPLVRRFETGGCHALEFANDVIAAYDLDFTPERFLVEFRAAAAGFYPEALELVREVASRHRVLSLSNINAVQWQAVLGLLSGADPFHGHHPSHQSGFHKPDARSYAAVAATHGETARYHFLDDRSENTAAAQAFGWNAHHVRGVAEARNALVRAGLLDG